MKAGHLKKPESQAVCFLKIKNQRRKRKKGKRCRISLVKNTVTLRLNKSKGQPILRLPEESVKKLESNENSIYSLPGLSP